nr:hypothetical protein Iba_chr10eCG10430 [Ipomoea batatas]
MDCQHHSLYSHLPLSSNPTVYRRKRPPRGEIPAEALNSAAEGVAALAAAGTGRRGFGRAGEEEKKAGEGGAGTIGAAKDGAEIDGISIRTREFPRVVAIEIKKSDEFYVETLAFHLTPEIELHQLFLRGVEPESGHHHIVFVLVGGFLPLNVLLAPLILVLLAHFFWQNCHKIPAARPDNSIQAYLALLFQQVCLNSVKSLAELFRPSSSPFYTT